MNEPHVLIHSEHPSGSVAARVLARLAGEFLTALRLRDAELSVVVTTDRKIRALNRDWRDKDQATDVLSFPLDEAGAGPAGRRPLGDIVISLDTARRRAKADRRPLERELARYLAHGVLHLLGHDHHEPRDAARMLRAEEKLLGGAGMLTGSPEAGPAPRPRKPRRGA